jgi:hypothetical protein
MWEERERENMIYVYSPFLYLLIFSMRFKQKGKFKKYDILHSELFEFEFAEHARKILCTMKV